MAGHDIHTLVRLQAGIEHLLDQHLSGCPRGMWHEHFGANGRLITTRFQPVRSTIFSWRLRS